MHSRPLKGLLEGIWHASIAAMLVWIVPRLLPEHLFWDITGANTWIIIGLFTAYIGALGATYLGVWFGLNKTYVLISAAASGAALTYFAILLLPSPEHSRRILLAATALYVAGFTGPIVLAFPPWRILLTAAGGVGLIALAVGLGYWLLPTGDPVAQVRRAVVAASQHTLEIDYYDNAVPMPSGQFHYGGAIAADPSGDGYFLAMATGEIYRFSWDGRDHLEVDDQGIRVPTNNGDFEADVDKAVSTNSFRVADILVRREGDATVLYASHHYWNRDDQCFVVRVSAHVLSEPKDSVAGSEAGSNWRTVFESRPCLRIEHARGSPFAGEQIGGNLESMSDGRLLLTVGDHQFDGWYRNTNLITDMSAHYGKTILIDPATGETEIFTIGHRNPQGLVVDAKGRIWSTEHGPQGGDELNLLRPGGNYGYPFHSYGTEYGGVTWPPMDSRDPAADYERPVFAWVPSIGISELIAVTDPAFGRWQDDLLVSSLKARQIWRVRLENDRVVYAEPILIGERVRDIAGRGAGEFVLWSDSDTIIRIRPLNALDDGAALFTVRCGGCHDDWDNRIGPSLSGLGDRDIASARGYAYSPDLRRLKGRWTDELLDAFIADPQSVAPGTKMAFEGIEDSEARKKLVDFITSSF